MSRRARSRLGIFSRTSSSHRSSYRSEIPGVVGSARDSYQPSGTVGIVSRGCFLDWFLYAWPVLHRAFQSRPLQIIYRPPAHTSMWRNLRDYYIEVRNCTTDRTISGVIVTWDQTPFTRFIDRKLYRECLLSPTSIEPSSSESVLLFSLKDDLDMDESKNDELRRVSTFTIRAIGNGTAESTARFKYEPNKIPKLRKLWR